MAVVGVVY